MLTYALDAIIASGHETIKMGALNLDKIAKMLMTDLTLSNFWYQIVSILQIKGTKLNTPKMLIYTKIVV